LRRRRSFFVPFEGSTIAALTSFTVSLPARERPGPADEDTASLEALRA
jgi:hypothetical protein